MRVFPVLVLAWTTGLLVRSQLTWTDRAGTPLGTLGEPADYVDVALSPDGATTLWTFSAPMSVLAAPLALANGVLWAILPVSETGFPTAPQKFTLLGLHADSGTPVAGHQFSGRAISGPAISNGRIYLVTDSFGATADAAGRRTDRLANPGAIVEFSYKD